MSLPSFMILAILEIVCGAGAASWGWSLFTDPTSVQFDAIMFGIYIALFVIVTLALKSRLEGRK